MKKRLLVMALVVWCSAVNAPAAASPLYGGYNGQSALWFDAFFFGADNQGRWWVRVPVDIVPGSLRTIFKLESGGILSAEIALYNIPGQDNFLFGIDSAGIFWGEIYQAAFLAGNDSSGNSWTEQTIFDFLGTGSDNSGNAWWFFTFPYQNIFPVTLGLSPSAFLPEPPVEASGQDYKETASLPMGAADREKAIKLMSYVTALCRDAKLVERAKALTLRTFHPASLLFFAEREVFSGERRVILEAMIQDLASQGSEF